MLWRLIYVGCGWAEVGALLTTIITRSWSHFWRVVHLWSVRLLLLPTPVSLSLWLLLSPVIRILFFLEVIFQVHLFGFLVLLVVRSLNHVQNSLIFGIASLTVGGFRVLGPRVFVAAVAEPVVFGDGLWSFHWLSFLWWLFTQDVLILSLGHGDKALFKIFNIRNVHFARNTIVGARPIVSKLVEMITFRTFPQLNRLHGWYIRLGLLFSLISPA